MPPSPSERIPATRDGSPEPLPVLFVNTDLRVGGQERCVVDLVRGADPARMRPVVACLKEPGALAPLVREVGVPLHSDLIRSRRDVRVLGRLRRLIRDEGIRVVCTVGCGDKMFWGRLAGRLAGVDGIVSAIHKTRNPDGGRILERSNRLLTPITDRFVAVAGAAADYLVEHEGLPRAKVVAIHNGVDLDTFRGEGRDEVRRELGLSPEAPVVVHVAVLRPEKGHEVLLAAAGRVVERVPEARFLLVGDGPRRPMIEAEIARRGLGESVRLLGQRSDVGRVLAAGDVAVLSSFDRVETFPISILEAMASGLPAVSTDVGSLREMITEGVEGRLVPEGDDAALGETLAELLADPAERSRMGARARSRVEASFTRAHMVRAYEDLFLEVAWNRR